MLSVLYLCESAGARLLAYGSGVTQIGDNYQLDLKTWDLIPAGEMGDCFFRSIDVTLEHEAGYAVGITPIVDGVDLTEQTFSAGGSGLAQVQASVKARGARIATRVRTLSRTGDVRVQNIASSFVIVRDTP